MISIRTYVIPFLVGVFFCFEVAQGSDEGPTTKALPEGTKAKEMCKIYSQVARSIECPINNVNILALGGQSANNGEFPHMVQIGFKEDNETNWACAGTLISKNFVLTVAHCLLRPTGKLPQLIRAGVTDQSDTSNAQIRNIIAIIRHPKYHQPAKYNDIGLVKVYDDFYINDYVRPACLYTEKTNPESKAINTGWGPTQIDQNERQKIMLKIYTKLVTNQICNSTIGKRALHRTLNMGIVEDKMVCAGVEKDTRNGCQQESGGPLQVIREDTEDTKCMYDVIGVLSFGVACGIADYIPSVYTRVSYYMEWIEDVVWN